MSIEPSPRVPVVMYHSINRPRPDWLWSGLSCPPALFARQLEALSRAGYRTVGMDEVRDHQTAGGPPPGKVVVLSFDDGYLDNWVHAVPLLRRYGMRGVVYVNPDFIDPSEEPRPTMDDVASGRIGPGELRSWGFLNRGELRALADEGILEVACHSRTHTWYPTGDAIVDFHRPGLATPWLAWNARPDRKHLYLTEDQDAFVPWGTPIHSHGRSLGIRRWLPDPDVASACAAAVRAAGGRVFFSGSGWRERLAAVAAEADRGRGRLESEAEKTNRFRDEIVDSRRDLEAIVGREVHHFAWPGGMYDDEAWEIALTAGYRTLPVKRSDQARWSKPDPRHVRRISCFDRITVAGRRLQARDPWLLLAACDEERARRGSRLHLRARKALTALGSILGRSAAER